MNRVVVLALAAAFFLAQEDREARASESDAVVSPEVSTARFSGALTLDDVVRSITLRHPLIAAAEREKAIASADVLSAEGGFDISVRARATTLPVGPYPNNRIETTAELPTGIWGTRLFAGYRVSRGSFAGYDGKLATADFGEARVGAQVPLWRDGPIDRRRAALQRAEVGIDVARVSLEQQRLETIRSGSHRYWEWVAAGRRVVVARSMLAIAVARDAGLEIRVARGDIPAFERAENDRIIHQRTAQVAATERALQSAAIELSLFLRDADGAPLRPDPSRLPSAFPVPEFRLPDTLGLAERQALARRPEIQRFDLFTRQIRIDRDLAQNQRKLGIDFFVSGAKDFGPSTDEKLTKPELELALILDVPLFTRVQDGRFDAARANLARLSLQAQFARERVVADVRDATSAVTMAEPRIAAVREEIKASRKLVEMEQQRFDLGEGTLLLVNLREQGLAEAQQREIDALADAFKAVASRRAAVGDSTISK